MNQTFIPANYPEKTYSGAELDILQKQMFGDLASIRVGPARIRQANVMSVCFVLGIHVVGVTKRWKRIKNIIVRIGSGVPV